ncbi:MAG: tRNA(Ile)(2)-agmatinylcytidine synthase [Candidatus Caldarchaeum sp.]|uniref:tRNA(Ile2) 2-agmatinylcytidine synthetase TiaS n=1 Tax=Caldiarchaeum subterraneum TaxID=311458 RepID=A0A7J3G3E8_CALS0
MVVVLLRIGVDDTDSVSGMCTTYVAAVAERRLLALGCEKHELSRLIRLNPNCPFKTRGNAALSLHFKVSDTQVEKAVETVLQTVEEFYEKGFAETQPGVVVYRGEDVPDEWKMFALRTVREIVGLDEAVELAEKHGAEVYRFNGGRGVIGALAAIALPLENPTYEAIAYRVRSNWGTMRRVDPSSVLELHRSGLSFDSYDPETGEIRITPHTPCPVLAGVRATSPENALKGLSMVRFHEEVEYVTVFATNQATDMHYIPSRIPLLKPFQNVVVEGRVVGRPFLKKGGHVFFRVGDDDGEIVCAAYRQTRDLRRVVQQLVEGDVVKVMGAVKEKPQGLTLNIEKIEVLKLAEQVVTRPPLCPKCGRRMESLGLNKGFRCGRCGEKLPPEARVKNVVPRQLRAGVYEAAVSARRHLTKPLSLCR